MYFISTFGPMSPVPSASTIGSRALNLPTHACLGARGFLHRLDHGAAWAQLQRPEAFVTAL